MFSIIVDIVILYHINVFIIMFNVVVRCSSIRISKHKIIQPRECLKSNKGLSPPKSFYALKYYDNRKRCVRVISC